MNLVDVNKAYNVLQTLVSSEFISNVIDRAEDNEKGRELILLSEELEK